MGRSTFYLPEGYVSAVDPPAPPPAPPTPAEAEANEARVNDLKNQFIDSKQQVLYTAPRAFLRLQGSDAITGAEATQQTLADLRQQTLDRTASNDQRTRLAEMLDWHLADAREQIHRHVAEQSDAWQQGVAARTVELATRQAALESSDAEKVGFVALAAYDAGKARALKAGVAPEAAHESGRAAWSGAYKAAIEMQAGNDPRQAVKLFDQAKATLDSRTREALRPRIIALSRDAEANALADRAMAPGADRASILDDPAVSPEVRQLAESKIASRETALSAARTTQIATLDKQIEFDVPQAMMDGSYIPGTFARIGDGYAATGDSDRTAIARTVAANEPLLTGFAAATPANQAILLTKFEPGPVRDQAIRIKAAGDQMLANDPLLWGAKTQRANGVGELVPLDLTPSEKNTPEAIAAALKQREQQASHIEVLSGQPTLPMTKDEIAALKATLDTAALPDMQRILRGVATGLSSGAVAQLARELAKQGPLADGYAFVLSTYAEQTPERTAVANNILDGLSRMKTAGARGSAIANTGPDWRGLFNEKVTGMLTPLEEDNIGAIRTATAALYIQSMALRGRAEAPLDEHTLGNAIMAVLGRPYSLSPVGLATGEEATTGPAGRRGTAPAVEPLSTNDPDFVAALQEWQGQSLTRPDGSFIADPYSPTGRLMGPFDDLSDVAETGRRVGAEFRGRMGKADSVFSPVNLYNLYEKLKAYVAQGGVFDYQRRINKDDPTGFVQLRQFRNVSNLNVGLFCQQAGLPLFVVLKIAGWYAGKNSSNTRPDEPYGLDPQTREFIERGYALGESGVFDRPKHPAQH